MKVYRASSLPLGFDCSESLRGEEEVKIHQPLAGQGTAVHAALAVAVERGVDAVELDRYVKEYDLDADEMAGLFFSGVKCWGELKDLFGKVSTELRLTAGTDTQEGNEGMLVGHIDVAHSSPKKSLILDWKTGRLDINYYHQLAAYAYLMMTDTQCQEVQAYIVWVRDGTYESFSFDRKTLEAWVQRFMDEVIYAPAGQYKVGAHCRFCPRFYNCPGRTGILKATARDLLEKPIVEGDLDYPFAELYGRVKMLQGAINQFDVCLRSHVTLNGPIDLGEGRQLQIIEQDRESLDTRKSWGVLSRQLDEEELAAACKIGKGKILQAIRDKAARGQKGKAVEKLMTELRAIGAVETRTTQMLKEIRT